MFFLYDLNFIVVYNKHFQFLVEYRMISYEAARFLMQELHKEKRFGTMNKIRMI